MHITDIQHPADFDVPKGKTASDQDNQLVACSSLAVNCHSNSPGSSCASFDEMITKFLTEVSTRLNPFSVGAKPARLFLTYLPPNARSSGMAISTTLLPRDSAEPSSLRLKFSA